MEFVMLALKSISQRWNMIADQSQYKLDRNKMIESGDIFSFREFLKKYGIKREATEENLNLLKQQAIWLNEEA